MKPNCPECRRQKEKRNFPSTKIKKSSFQSPALRWPRDGSGSNLEQSVPGAKAICKNFPTSSFNLVRPPYYGHFAAIPPCGGFSFLEGGWRRGFNMVHPQQITQKVAKAGSNHQRLGCWEVTLESGLLLKL